MGQLQKAAITGMGMSTIGRLTQRPAMDHLLESALEALECAGLTRDDIDGITTYPGHADKSPGMSPLGTGDVRNALGLKTRWHSATPEGAAQASGPMTAAMAVMTGQARHVLCFRTLTESSSQTPERRASIPAGSGRVGGWFSDLMPMNSLSASNWAAMYATRIMHDYGLTREHLGMIATSQRANACLNPRAVFQKPLTMDEYRDARMISDPLCLFDCDIPIDGSCVFIISALDAARDCRQKPLIIEAMGSAMKQPDSWDQQKDLTTMASHDAAADMWERTDLTAKDVDVAGLYDGFSIFVPMWLEALGFFEKGGAPEFIANGNIRLDGRIPVNTCGGQLSGGRMHGFGLMRGVCEQLWGMAGARQLAKADVGVCAMGGGPLAGTLLIRKEG